ncbi:MAG: LamG-like jellyroll fold domain-containing protein, partial [bacterium]
RLFAQKPIWPSLAEHQYLGGYNGAAPIHYWPLDEERNSDKFETLRDDGVVGGTRLVPRGPYRAGQTGRLPWDTRAMARVGDAGTQYQAIKQVITGTDWNPDPGGNWTLEFTMFVDDPTLVQVLVTEDDASPMLQIWSDGGGGIQYRIFYTDSTNSQQGTPQARPGEFHHCALGVASDGSIFAYLDGVFHGSVAGDGKTPRAADELYLGIQDNETNQLTGEIGRVAVFDYRRVSSGQITEQHTAYRNPWGSESPGTRSVRLLDDIDDLIDRFAWPRELNAIEFPSERTILPMMGGGTLLEYLREMERSESGLLYVDRSGVVVLIKRSQIIPSPPAVVTYSDSGAAGTTPYQTVSFRPNPDLVNT